MWRRYELAPAIVDLGLLSSLRKDSAKYVILGGRTPSSELLYNSAAIHINLDTSADLFTIPEAMRLLYGKTLPDLPHTPVGDEIDRIIIAICADKVEKISFQEVCYQTARYQYALFNLLQNLGLFEKRLLIVGYDVDALDGICRNLFIRFSKERDLLHFYGST